MPLKTATPTGLRDRLWVLLRMPLKTATPTGLGDRLWDLLRMPLKTATPTGLGDRLWALLRMPLMIATPTGLRDRLWVLLRMPLPAQLNQGCSRQPWNHTWRSLCKVEERVFVGAVWLLLSLFLMCKSSQLFNCLTEQRDHEILLRSWREETLPRWPSSYSMPTAWAQDTLSVEPSPCLFLPPHQPLVQITPQERKCKQGGSWLSRSATSISLPHHSTSMTEGCLLSPVYSRENGALRT